MAVSSIANLFSFFKPSKPPPPPPPTPKTPFLQFSPSPTDSHPSSRINQDSLTVSNNDNNTNTLPLTCSNSAITSVVFPSLAYANTLFFRSAYNVQVIVDDHEHEERLIGRFRREVMKVGVIQECKRRRYFENPQDKEKRKSREAARRNRRRRGPPRNFTQDKQETSKSKRNDDDEDNWELPVGDIPN